VKAPVDEVRRTEEREGEMECAHLVAGEIGFADNFFFGNGAGADGVVFAVVFPDEGIGKVVLVNWIFVLAPNIHALGI
jgi:hypothetical protein